MGRPDAWRCDRDDTCARCAASHFGPRDVGYLEKIGLVSWHGAVRLDCPVFCVANS